MYTTQPKNGPIGEQISLALLHDNPYPTFEALLAHEPVSWVPALKMWLVTRRDDVIAILKDPATFTNESEHSLIEDTLGRMMLTIDGAAHRRLRNPFAAPFRPRLLRRQYTEVITEATHRLIDDLIDENDEGVVDLDKVFSDRLALYAVTEVLGLPIENEAQFRGWYDAFADAIANFQRDATIREAGQVAWKAYRAYVLERISYLTKHPDHSVLSQLIQASEHDLTPDEIVSGTAITIFGGLETTAALLSNTIWALLRHPEQLAMVRRKPALMAGAVEESLRWEAPVQTLTRHLTRDVELHGMTIKKGETISCMIGAANRDPSFFEKPAQFNIQRPNARQNLSFGLGVHFCLGAPLARMEGTIGLPILLKRLPKLKLPNGKTRTAVRALTPLPAARLPTLGEGEDLFGSSPSPPVVRGGLRG